MSDIQERSIKLKIAEGIKGNYYCFDNAIVGMGRNDEILHLFEEQMNREEFCRFARLAEEYQKDIVEILIKQKKESGDFYSLHIN